MYKKYVCISLYRLHKNSYSTHLNIYPNEFVEIKKDGELTNMYKISYKDSISPIHKLDMNNHFIEYNLYLRIKLDYLLGKHT